MPITIKELIAGVRDYLLYPDYRRVTNATVMLRIQDKSDMQRTAFGITNRGWFLSRVDLFVDPGTDEFPLSSPVGRPVACYTVDDTDPNHVEREVEIVVVQNRDLYYTGTKTGIGSYTIPHIASCISIFNDVDAGQWIAKVTPQHQQSAQYVIWYVPDRPTPPGLNDNYPLMEAFVNLLKVDVALSLLPNIMVMDDKGNVRNGAQVTMAERRLTDDRDHYLALFNVAKQQAAYEQTGPRRGWADDSQGGFDYWW